MRQTRASRSVRVDNVSTSPLKPESNLNKQSKRGSSLASPVVLFILVFGLWVIYLRGSSLDWGSPPVINIPTDALVVSGASSKASVTATPPIIPPNDPHDAGPIVVSPVVTTPATAPEQSTPVAHKLSTAFTLDATCTDPTWCSIPMPSESHFAFTSVPNDKARWRMAQRLAASGEPVLSKEILASFPQPDDFLDGDPFGQNYDRLVDIFLTYETMMSPLTGGKQGPETDNVKKLRGSKPKEFRRTQYTNSFAHRAPVIQLGTYKYTGRRYVQMSGDNRRTITLDSFLTEFEAMEGELKHPCVFMATLDKDWGYLSEPVAQRVSLPSSERSNAKDIMPPLSTGDKQRLLKALDSEKIVMLIINQHCNITHPKLLTLPYGLVLDSYFDKKAVWDSLRLVLKTNRKAALLYKGDSLSESSEKVAQGLSSRIPPSHWLSDMEGDETDSLSAQEKKTEYYHHINKAMTGLFLPDIGLDAQRHWEMLYMGVLGVAERNKGLDRLYWKLPVLLVDDFAMVTTSLLQTAYVEAIYHRKEFEFNRLQQSFWYGLVYEVSQASSAAAMIKKFPLVASGRRPH